MWILSMEREMYSLDRSIAPTLIRSFGASWEISCGGSTGQHFSIMSNKSTMILWIHSGSSSSSTMSMSVRFTTYPITYPHLWWRTGSTMRHIGSSVTENYLKIISALQQDTEFQHKLRINWMTTVHIIVSCLTKNVVGFCPPWRQKIIESKVRIKKLRPLSQRRTILTVIHPEGCCVRGRQVLAS